MFRGLYVQTQAAFEQLREVVGLVTCEIARLRDALVVPVAFGLRDCRLVRLYVRVCVLASEAFVLSLDDALDLYGRLIKYLVHLDRENVCWAQELEREVPCLLVCEQC